MPALRPISRRLQCTYKRVTLEANVPVRPLASLIDLRRLVLFWILDGRYDRALLGAIYSVLGHCQVALA